MSKNVDTAVEAPKRKGPAKGTTAAPTTVLLYVNSDGKPAVFAHSRNGRALVQAFQDASRQGIELTIAELAVTKRAAAE